MLHISIISTEKWYLFIDKNYEYWAYSSAQIHIFVLCKNIYLTIVFSDVQWKCFFYSYIWFSSLQFSIVSQNMKTMLKVVIMTHYHANVLGLVPLKFPISNSDWWSSTLNANAASTNLATDCPLKGGNLLCMTIGLFCQATPINVITFLWYFLYTHRNAIAVAGVTWSS